MWMDVNEMWVQNKIEYEISVASSIWKWQIYFFFLFMNTIFWNTQMNKRKHKFHWNDHSDSKNWVQNRLDFSGNESIEWTTTIKKNELNRNTHKITKQNWMWLKNESNQLQKKNSLNEEQHNRIEEIRTDFALI